MNAGLYRSGVALAARQRQLDSVARNLANVGTTGFKRGTSGTAEFAVRQAQGVVRGITTTTRTDFSQGDLERTGRPLDLALQGEGFFALEGSDGEMYTRDGAFQASVDGEIVSGEGFPIAWESRSGAIDPTGFPLEIDGEGTVRQGQETIGTIKVVNFERPERLTVSADGYWAAPAGLKAATSTAVVHQGALEGSNATAIGEMIDMIEIQRSFESLARMMSSIEQSYRRLTRPV